MTTPLPEPQRDERSQAMNAQKIKELVETYRQPYNGALTAARTELHAAIDSLKAKWDALESENRLLRTQLEAARKDAPRIEFVAIYGSFGCDSVSGLLSGNGQKRLAATRKNIDAAIAATKGTTS